MSKYPLAISRLIEKYPEARMLKINEEVTAYEFGKYKARIDSHPSEGGAFGLIITADKKLVLIKRADSCFWIFFYQSANCQRILTHIITIALNLILIRLPARLLHRAIYSSYQCHISMSSKVRQIITTYFVDIFVFHRFNYFHLLGLLLF